MACDLTLQISNYNVETNKKETIPVPLGQVEENQNISIDYIADVIAKLDKETRSTLAAQLRAAKVQNISNKTVEDHQIISNISLNDLVKQYPDLSKYDIPKDLQYKFTLLKCYRAEFSGTTYKGRTVDSKGNEIFIVNNIWDAEKLFKHLSVKLNLNKFIQGNNLDESLKDYEEDLDIIARRYKKNIQKLIEDFLINKNAYNTFKQGNKLYNPRRIINKVLSQITGELYDEGDKSDLQLELESIKESTGSKNEWKFEKRKLYDVLTTFFDDFQNNYTFDQFKELDTNTLNEILTSLFADDVKLIKTTVKTSTQGQKIVKEAPKEKKRINVRVADVQKMYEDTLLAAKPDLPKRFQDAAKQLKQGFINALKPLQLTTTDENGINHDLFLEMDENFKVKVYYEVEQEPIVKEKSAYITLNLNNWSSIGEIYDFSYADQPLFSPTEQYKGFYIYEYHKNGKTHYAISRSIISPKSYMKTFSSLEAAKQNIDTNKDTLQECGLWSIKQQISRPRASEIEMKYIREGSIITTLDIQLPRFEFKNFSDTVKELFKGTITNFYNKLEFVENIKSLDTPEKASAFIYLVHKQLKHKQDFMEFLKDNSELSQSIIKDINSRKTISYLVEKVETFGKSPNKYYLRLLQNNGTNIDIDGKFNDITVQDFIDQNLNNVIEYFNNQFGIGITSVTRSELEQFSRDNDLDLENKLDIVKAFVYNGQIYINTSNANVEDLFHELSHILLGVVKAKDLNMYNELIDSYKTKNGYKYLFNTHRKTYKHYSEQDVIEETVADMIASEMFKLKQLGTSDFKGNEILELFENILKKSERFTQAMNDNGLGFSKYINQLLDENGNEMQRNMKISNLVRDYISEGKIQEKC